jgi:hypothetical protein
MMLGLAAAGGCAERGPSHTAQPGDGIMLELIARSAQIPYSRSESLAVPSPDRACIFDSYEIQIICGDRTWTDLVRGGRKGAGPGELGPSGYLVSAPDGQVAFIDSRNSRVSIFSNTLEFVRSTPLRTSLYPLGAISANWVLGGSTLPSYANLAQTRALWIDLDSGIIAREIVLRFEPESPLIDPITVIPALQANDGKILARMGRGQLGWFSDDGAFIELLELPDFGPSYPTEYDVEQHIDEYTWVTLGRAPSEQQLREFRSQPLSRHLRGGADRALQVDKSDRIWIATTRRGTRGSSLDLVRGSQYVGSIEIDDQLIAFQITDTLLVALVASRHADESGLHPRRIDWYRIATP